GDTVALLFGLYMAYYIFDNMMFLMEKGSVYTSVRWLKQWVMYLPGVLGLLGFSLRLIETSIYPILKDLFNKKYGVKELITTFIFILLILLFLTFPIAVSLGLSTIIIFFIYYQEVDMISNLAQSMVKASDSFTLIALPFFMLIGSLMEKSKIADDLIDFAGS